VTSPPGGLSLTVDGSACTAPDKIKFFGVVKGNCWLCIDGKETPVHVKPGDVFLVSAQRSFVTAGDLAAVRLDLRLKSRSEPSRRCTAPGVAPTTLCWASAVTNIAAYM
jgi:Cupin